MSPQPDSSSTVVQQPVTRLYSLQLLNFGANALAKPYVNLYLVASGITASTLGILLSIAALVEMLLPPLLNTLADRHRRHRILYMGFIGTLALSSILLASFDQHVVLAVAAVMLEGSFRPSGTLGMQLVITRMTFEGRQIVGRVRSFSSLGFGLASLLASRLFALGGYFALFASAAMAYLTSLSLAGSLPTATTQQQSEQPVRREPRTWEFYIVLVSMFFMEMGQRTGAAFWLVHFQQNLGISTGEISFFIAIMALVEIPFFLLLDRVLLRVDLRLVFLTGGVGLAVFWFSVGIIPSKAWIYLLLVLRGFVFATFHLSMFLVIARVSNPVNVATNQSLAQGTVPSLAVLLTGSMSGWIYEHIGATTLFAVVMGLCLVGMSITVLAFNQLRDRNA